MSAAAEPILARKKYMNESFGKNPLAISSILTIATAKLMTARRSLMGSRSRLNQKMSSSIVINPQPSMKLVASFMHLMLSMPTAAASHPGKKFGVIGLVSSSFLL